MNSKTLGIYFLISEKKVEDTEKSITNYTIPLPKCKNKNISKVIQNSVWEVWSAFKSEH